MGARRMLSESEVSMLWSHFGTEDIYRVNDSVLKMDHFTNEEVAMLLCAFVVVSAADRWTAETQGPRAPLQLATGGRSTKLRTSIDLMS